MSNIKWMNLQGTLMKMGTAKECEAFLEEQTAGGAATTFLLRIQSRLQKLRRIEERAAIRKARGML